MQKIKFVLTTAVCCLLLFQSTINAQMLYDVDHIKKVKSSIAAGEKEYLAAFNKLKKDAQKALGQEPLSVTTKKQVPPSGDKHDYMSLGKYWWPDPSKPDGSPYIRKDGEVFPGTADYQDPANFGTMLNNVTTLSLGYYFTGDKAFAEKAAALLKVWFLNPETKMNPNLNFAQAVIGSSDGRGAGVIDLHGIPKIIDAVKLLHGSAAWSEKDNDAMKQWFSDYLTWLLESKNGKAEAKAKNNHGVWYDVQVTSIALFVGKSDLAKKVVSESKKNRIESQIEPDGKQPLELARTTSKHYTMFNIEAFINLSILAEKCSVDLWNYKSADGRCIKATLDFMVPYLLDKKKWEYKQIKDFDMKKFNLMYVKAYNVYKDKIYQDLIAESKNSEYKKQRTYLLFSDVQ